MELLFMYKLQINATTIHGVLKLMMMMGWVTALDGVNGALLHGEFHNREQIYMKVPQGWEAYYSNTALLELLKFVCGLKQSVMAFWEELLRCIKHVEME